MQGTQPRLMELRATFSGDTERQSQEMMALYNDGGRDHGDELAHPMPRR